MKKMVMVALMVFAQSAFAVNGSLLDNAVNSNLKDQKQLQMDHSDAQPRPKAIRGDKLNAKYEVLEVGDEMGSFAAANKGSYSDDRAVEKKADAAKELRDINAEVSDSTL